MEKGSSSSAANGGPPAKKIYFEGGAPPSPAKKGRTGAAQPPSCQVEGCHVDLSDAKAYYSRHKVCVMHSKSPMVVVAGISQRFCQQCSRFHQLAEFDQGKRSCRRRLAGHNERRRKLPPGSMLSACYGGGTLCPSIFESHTKAAGFVMDLSAYPNPTLTGRDSELGNHQLPWQSTSQNPPSGPGSEECFDGVPSFASALSLLSNQPWASKAQSASLGVDNLLGTDGTPLVHSSVNPVAAVGPFAWGNNTLHDMQPVLGLGQSSDQYGGGLSSAQPNEGQFHELDFSSRNDSPIQHMHWSL